MPRAVRFDRYGPVDVLDVVEVPAPVPGPAEALVRVKAAGINPGEAAIREGKLHGRWPSTFPSGQGSDLAGVVEQLAAGVEGLDVGDEVIGYSDNRDSQADFVVVPVQQLVARPPNVSWEVGGGLSIVGRTAYAAVRAVAIEPGDVVVVSGAAGGVGSLAVQLAGLAGAKVIGLAGQQNHAWLREHGVIPVSYGDGVQERIRGVGAGAVDAFIDTFGDGYVELALALGVAPQRIDTIADFQAAEKYGVKAEGSMAASDAQVLAELARLIDEGRLELPIAAIYPLERVREAYQELEQRHTRGKIVLTP